MYEGYRVIVVTPAGRRRYLEILKTYLDRHRNIIDEWHLWVNTCDEGDVEWMRGQEGGFIRLVEATEGVDRGTPAYSIHQFFRHTTDPRTIYLRFDDDIVYVHPRAVAELCRERVTRSEPFLVYANTVNNSVCTYLHQRMGAIELSQGKVNYNCLDPLGWGSGEVAVDVHRQFLDHIRCDDLDRYMFPRWYLWEADRVSINCFAYFGSDFGEFGGVVPVDEEVWLGVTKPRELGRSTMIAGGALVGHYAYYTQRPVVEESGILAAYRALTE